MFHREGLERKDMGWKTKQFVPESEGVEVEEEDELPKNKYPFNQNRNYNPEMNQTCRNNHTPLI